jgi:mRNA-degrading endonuclease toxin of MazEF toxin-antitoxin module
MVGRYVPGTVVLATISFDEQEEAKRRPAVIIGEPAYWGRDTSALVCPVTSVAPRPGDVAIDWRAAGLIRASCVRPRPRTIAKSRVHWEVGALDASDLAALHEALKRALGLCPGGQPAQGAS